MGQGIKDIFSQKQKALLVSCILIVFFFAALIAMILIPQKKAPALAEYRLEPLNPDQEILLPQGPSVPSGYATSRRKKDRWSQSEIDSWFTEAGGKTDESLEKANDRIVESITEAAP